MREDTQAGDLVAACGVLPSVLQRWSVEGVLRPVAGGGGRGAFRKYTFAQALAVAVGAAFRAAGATPAHAEGVARFVAGTAVDDLLAACAAGRTFAHPCARFGTEWLPGTMAEPPAGTPARLDVGVIHRELTEKLAALEGKSAGARRGRTRRPRAEGVAV